MYFFPTRQIRSAIDKTERPIQKPTDQQRRKNVFWKEKQTTRKGLVMTNKENSI